MKKRIFTVAMVLVLVVALASTAFAAGSKTAGVQPTVTSTANGNGDTIIVNELDTSVIPTDVAELCKEINAGTKMISDIPGLDLADKTALSAVYNVRWASSADKHDGATFTVSYAEITGPVYLVHYSNVRNTWELVKCDSYDAAAHTATFTLQDVSPFALVADQGTTNHGGNQGGAQPAAKGAATSPATGAGLLG